MYAYIIRRLLLAVALIYVVTTMIFFLIHMVPGDAVLVILGEDYATPEKIATLRHQLGLDKPLHVQYISWLERLVHGDLGQSLINERPVAPDLMKRLPRTLELIIAAVIVSVLAGIPAGIYAATHRNRPGDLAASTAALIGLSAPVFVIGPLLILLLSLKLGWLPATGYAAFSDDPWRHFQSLLQPTLTLASSMSAVTMRMTRSSLLEVLGQDYIRTARAKGLTEKLVLYKHAIKNSLIPVITVVGMQMGTLLGGSVIVEFIFNWPGISTYLLDGISQRDYPLVQGVVLLISTLFIMINLAVDLLYSYLDPRIKYQ